MRSPTSAARCRGEPRSRRPGRALRSGLPGRAGPRRCLVDARRAWNGSAARLDRALAAHRRAVTVPPARAERLVNLGSTLVELTRYDEAHRHLTMAALLDPGLAGVLERHRLRPAGPHATRRGGAELPARRGDPADFRAGLGRPGGGSVLGRPDRHGGRPLPPRRRARPRQPPASVPLRHSPPGPSATWPAAGPTTTPFGSSRARSSASARRRAGRASRSTARPC